MKTTTTRNKQTKAATKQQEQEHEQKQPKPKQHYETTLMDCDTNEINLVYFKYWKCEFHHNEQKKYVFLKFESNQPKVPAMYKEKVQNYL